MSDEWNDTDSARALGWLRVAAGAVLLLAPRLGVRSWTGERTEDVTTNLAVRGMGARDIGLGLGLVFALERGGSTRGWLEAGAVADGGDAFGTLAAWGDLPKSRALFWLAAEVGATVLGLRLAQSLD